MNGILGKKIGMTQVFTEDGRCFPATVIQVGPCIVVQKRTLEKEGYSAIQVGFEEVDFKKLNKPLKGHFQKRKLKAYGWLKEFRVENSNSYEEGQEVLLDFLAAGDLVSATGISKGKGFQGVIKRHHKKGGPKTHGSCFHRSTGSIGQRTYPGKVFKNMKLPGHMGDRQVTVKNLEVIRVLPEQKLLFVKGAIPGAVNSRVIIKKAISSNAEVKAA